MPSLCGVAVKWRQTNTPQFSAETSTPRFARCTAIRMYILFYFTMFYLPLEHTWRVQKTLSLQAWDQWPKVVSESKLFSEMTLPEQLAEESQNKAKTLSLFSAMVTNDIYCHDSLCHNYLSRKMTALLGASQPFSSRCRTENSGVVGCGLTGAGLQAGGQGEKGREAAGEE